MQSYRHATRNSSKKWESLNSEPFLLNLIRKSLIFCLIYLILMMACTWYILIVLASHGWLSLSYIEEGHLEFIKISAFFLSKTYFEVQTLKNKLIFNYEIMYLGKYLDISINQSE